MRVINGIAAATTDVEIGANLDADPDRVRRRLRRGRHGGPTTPPTAAAACSRTWSAAVQVFDPLGGAHNLQIAFLKDPAANTWNVEIYADRRRSRGRPIIPTACSRTGTVTFNGDGTLATATSRPTTRPRRWARRSASTGSTPAARATARSRFDLGSVDTADGLSQFASDYNVAFVNQNGAEVGELNGVNVDDEGFVVATFTNGATQRIYRLPLATFANPLALDPRTGNVYAQTSASGEFNLRNAGEGGAGDDRALGARSGQCRSGRRVHQNDRHPARLFSQCARHHNGR